MGPIAGKRGVPPRVGVRADSSFKTPHPYSTISKVGRLGGRSGQSAYAAVQEGLAEEKEEEDGQTVARPVL